MNGLKLVFCEGGDDLAVIQGVSAAIGVADLLVERFDGKNNLRNFLRVLKTRPEFAQNKVAAIAIIRDADEDEAAAFQSVCDALKANDFEAPEKNDGFRVNGTLGCGPKYEGIGGWRQTESTAWRPVRERCVPCRVGASNYLQIWACGGPALLRASF